MRRGRGSEERRRESGTNDGEEKGIEMCKREVENWMRRAQRCVGEEWRRGRRPRILGLNWTLDGVWNRSRHR